MDKYQQLSEMIAQSERIVFLVEQGCLLRVACQIIVQKMVNIRQ